MSHSYQWSFFCEIWIDYTNPRQGFTSYSSAKASCEVEILLLEKCVN